MKPSVIIRANRNVDGQLAPGTPLVFEAWTILVSETDLVDATFTWSHIDSDHRGIGLRGDRNVLYIDGSIFKPLSINTIRVTVEGADISMATSITINCSNITEVVVPISVADLEISSLVADSIYESDAYCIGATLTTGDLDLHTTAVYSWTLLPSNASYPLDLEQTASAFGIHGGVLSFPHNFFSSGDYWFTAKVSWSSGEQLTAILKLTVQHQLQPLAVKINSRSSTTLNSARSHQFDAIVLTPTDSQSRPCFLWSLYQDITNGSRVQLQPTFPMDGSSVVIPQNFLRPSGRYLLRIGVSVNVGTEAVITSAEQILLPPQELSAGTLTIVRHSNTVWSLLLEGTCGDTNLQPYKYSFWVGDRNGTGMVPLTLDSRFPKITMDVPKLLSHEIFIEGRVKDEIGQIASVSREVVADQENVLNPDQVCHELFECPLQDDEMCDRAIVSRFIVDCHPLKEASAQCVQGISSGILETIDTYTVWTACTSHLSPRAIGKMNGRFTHRIEMLLSPLLSVKLSAEQGMQVLHLLSVLISKCQLPLLPTTTSLSVNRVQRVSALLVDVLQQSMSSIQRSRGCILPDFAQMIIAVISEIVNFANHICNSASFYGREYLTEINFELDKFSVSANSTKLRPQPITLPSEDSMFELMQRTSATSIDVIRSLMIGSASCSEDGTFPSGDGLGYKLEAKDVNLSRIEMFSDNTFLLGLRVTPGPEGITIASKSLQSPVACPAIYIPLATIPKSLRPLNGDSDFFIFVIVQNQICSRHCDNIVSPVIRLDFGSLDGKPVATIPWTGPPVMLTVEAHVADDLANNTHCMSDTISNSWSTDGSTTFHEANRRAPMSGSHRACILDRLPANFAVLRPCGTVHHVANPVNKTRLAQQKNLSRDESKKKIPENTKTHTLPDKKYQIELIKSAAGLRLPDFNTAIDWGNFRDLDWLGIVIAGVVIGVVLFTGLVFVLVYHSFSTTRPSRSSRQPDAETGEYGSESTLTDDDE